MPTTIRTATDADIGGLAALFAELDDFHRAHRPDLFRPVDGPAREHAHLAALVRGPLSTVFVADRDGAVVGLSVVIEHNRPALAFRPERRFAEIDAFGLTAGARRSGLGRRLMAASEAWARARGIDRLELTVHAFNAGAIAFYGQDGFTPMTHRLERAVR